MKKADLSSRDTDGAGAAHERMAHRVAQLQRFARRKPSHAYVVGIRTHAGILETPARRLQFQKK